MNFAIIGATGNVGRKTIEVLEKSKLKIENLYLVASKKSAGQKMRFNNNEIIIQGKTRDKVTKILEDLGHKVKRIGG